MDIALMQADGSAKGSADLAFDAHLIPIGDWARAAWEERVPRSTLMAMAAQAQLRLVRARNVWAKVIGLATTMVATCARIHWVIIDALRLRPDTGVKFDLRVDPPAVVEKMAQRREAIS